MKPGPTSRRRAALAILACLAWPLSAHAQQGTDKVADLERFGVVYMDGIATPLLHHVMTGAPYRANLVAAERGDSPGIPRDLEKVLWKLNSRNEFNQEEATPQWQSYLDTRVELLRHARAYLIPMTVEWQRYDFAQSRYAISVRMNRRSPSRNGPTYHCDGAFATAPNHDLRTSCLHAINEDQHDPFLREFRLEDRALAREVRENASRFGLLALARPAGNYKVLRGTEMRYAPGEIFAAAGFLPVSITHLLLVDRGSGAIYAMTSRPGAGPAPWEKDAAATPAGAAAPPAQAGPPAAAAAPIPGWRLLERNEAGALYVDPDSVRREHALVMVRTLTDFSSRPESGAYSVISWYESDCGKRTVRQVQSKGYAERQGSGALVVEVPDAQPPQVPPAGTVVASLFTFACNARPPKS